MGQPACARFARALSALSSLAACLLCFAGCNNTCVSGTLNGPGGSVIDVKSSSPPPACVLDTANGIVHTEIGAAPGALSAPGTTFAPDITGPHMTHLFVTIAGIDVHSSPLANDNAPGWLPLAQLQEHPLQIDLLADPHANAASAPLPDAVLPTGTYRQIRLRFASQPPKEFAPGTNPCGAAAAHCAARSDGRVWPVALPFSQSNLRIVLDGAPGHELYVPPEGTVALTIELDRERSFLWPLGDSMLLNPVFHLRMQQPLNLSAN